MVKLPCYISYALFLITMTVIAVILAIIIAIVFAIVTISGKVYFIQNASENLALCHFKLL